MSEPRLITIVVNGETASIRADSTVAELLTQLNIVSRAIAVECNQEILPSHRFQQHILEPDDILEIVTLVGGG
jgi:thiamine biosynthesis protein ThiS